VQFAYYGSLNVYDLSLHGLTNVAINGRVDGLAFDKSGTFLYAYLIDTGVVAKYDVATWTLVDQFTVGMSNWHNNIGSGDQLHLSSDGSYITVADTGTGTLRMIDLTARNEVFTGTAGADNFSGLDGNDTYYINHAGDSIVETLANGNDLALLSVSFTLPANVERGTVTVTTGLSVTGNALANMLTGNSGNDTLNGGGGDDELDGGAGADTMTGGTGDDTYHLDQSGDAVVELAGEGIDTIVASFDYGLIAAGVENLRAASGIAAINLTGNGNANRIEGNAGANVLRGGGGDDLLYGMGGNDILEGGDGNDTYHVDAGDVVTEAAGEGIDTIVAAINYMLGANTNVENLRAAAGNDTIALTGDGAVNRIEGNEGANLLRGGGGDDVLYGMDGNDTLRGDAGNDKLYGGLGNDSYVVDDAGDQVFEAGSEGNDLLVVAANYVLATGQSIERVAISEGDAETWPWGPTLPLNFTGNEIAQNIAGNEAANVIDGGGGNDYIDGRRGDDTLIGGAGNDTLFGDFGADTLRGGADDDVYRIDAGDIVIELGNEGWDTVEAGFSYTLGDNVEVLTLTGTGNIDGTGNSAANTLNGNSGANRLEGGAGSDLLVGGAGNDTLIGGADNDTLIGGDGADTANYTDATGGVTVSLTTEQPQSTGGAGTDILASIENLEGSAFDDQLAGDNADNMLAGNDGQDWLIGGGGADVQTGGEGHDSVWGGDGSDLLDGGAGDDTIFGGAGIDTVSYAAATGAVEIDLSFIEEQLTRGAGIDTLVSIENVIGSGFGDVLAGNAGANVLTGGGGNDRFVFAGTGARDTIADFTSGDAIDLGAIDANGAAAGDAAFAFIGASGFSGVAGQLRATGSGTSWLVEADLNGDSVTDFSIAVVTTSPISGLAVSDFLV
jgi:Ca2+-binding RTX toxin-like protein